LNHVLVSGVKQVCLMRGVYKLPGHIYMMNVC
jgi:hypothetical protein